MKKWGVLLILFFSMHAFSKGQNISYNLNFEDTPENIELLDQFLLSAFLKGKNTGIKIDTRNSKNLLKVSVRCVQELVCTDRINKFLSQIEDAGVKWNGTARPNPAAIKANQ